METILVALDFSDVTEKLVEQACRLAAALGATLRMVHVAAPDPEFVGFEAGPQSVRDQQAGEFRKEHRRLQELAERVRREGIETKALLVQGPAVETILEQAAKGKADLIVAGSHGHGRLYTALVGSVSEGILRKATCPVLLVPAR